MLPHFSSMAAHEFGWLERKVRSYKCTHTLLGNPYALLASSPTTLLRPSLHVRDGCIITPTQQTNHRSVAPLGVLATAAFPPPFKPPDELGCPIPRAEQIRVASAYVERALPCMQSTLGQFSLRPAELGTRLVVPLSELRMYRRPKGSLRPQSHPPVSSADTRPGNYLPRNLPSTP